MTGGLQDASNSGRKAKRGPPRLFFPKREASSKQQYAPISSREAFVTPRNASLSSPEAKGVPRAASFSSREAKVNRQRRFFSSREAKGRRLVVPWPAVLLKGAAGGSGRPASGKDGEEARGHPSDA